MNRVSTLNLRLPEAIVRRLDEITRLKNRSRSEIVRAVIVEYFDRREHERILAELVDAARALASNPDARRESLEIANDLVGDGLDANLAEELSVEVIPKRK